MKKNNFFLLFLTLALTGIACAAMRPQQAAASESHRVADCDARVMRVNWRKACRGAEDDAMLNEFLEQNGFPTLDQDDQAIHAKDTSGMTPLHWAVGYRNNKVVTLLLARGADINARDLEGFAPLHYAARVGNTEFAALLLARGAGVNAQDNRGLTPFDIAVGGKRTACAELLKAAQEAKNKE